METVTTGKITKGIALCKLLLLTVINLMLQILILILKAVTCLSVVATVFFLLLGLLAGCGSHARR